MNDIHDPRALAMRTRRAEIAWTAYMVWLNRTTAEILFRDQRAFLWVALFASWCIAQFGARL